MSSRPGRASSPTKWALIALTFTTLSLAACATAGSDAAAPPPVGSPAAVSPAAVTPAGSNPAGSNAAGGEAANGQALAERMASALSEAGGSTVSVTINDRPVLTGTFVFGRVGALGLVETWQQARVSADAFTARYIGRTGTADDTFYIDDGRVTDGRHWAQAPIAASQLLDAETLVRTRPAVGLLPMLAGLIDPHTVSVGLASTEPRSAGHETVAGVDATHYRWTLASSGPDAGADQSQEVWLDPEGRPLRYRGTAQGLPLDVTYGNFGKQAPISAPPASDVDVLPTVDAG